MINRKPLALLLAATLCVATAQPCTVFLIARDGRVLDSNNEDWPDPNTKIWFVAPQQGHHYGCVFFGFGTWFAQGA